MMVNKPELESHFYKFEVLNYVMSHIEYSTASKGAYDCFEHLHPLSQRLKLILFYIVLDHVHSNIVLG